MQMSAMSPSPLQISTVPRSTPPIQSELSSGLFASSLSLGLLPLPPTSSSSHQRVSDHIINVEPLAAAHPLPEPSVPPPAIILPLPKIKLSEIAPYDGAPTPVYNGAVEALSTSLMNHNAAVIVLGSDESALLKCALESGKLYFRMRAQCGGNWSKGLLKRDILRHHV